MESHRHEGKNADQRAVKTSLPSAPLSLTGLFGADSDLDEDLDNSGHAGKGGTFENEEEVMDITLAGTTVKINQLAWHQANANQVWPGTFTLAEHLVNTLEPDGTQYRYDSGKILELGAATGALSIALLKTPGRSFDIITRYC